MIIDGKTFLNTQEAVAWLLKNNALPFQSTANYAPNTEIAKTTIINPSPAEIKVGALVLFADSKVGTVSGITSNGFIVGQEYTDIKNALAYIVSVTLNGSNHLITTLSDGTTKDAGLVKEVASMSINSSQHLIVTYNDGTTNDLGAIFSGNLNISGNLNVSGAITGNSIIENMTGFSFTGYGSLNPTLSLTYVGIVKNGNKLTMAIAGTYTPDGNTETSEMYLGRFYLPSDVAEKLIPIDNSGTIAVINSDLYQNLWTDLLPKRIQAFKPSSSPTSLILNARYWHTGVTANTQYFFRSELTFLLSDNLA